MNKYFSYALVLVSLYSVNTQGLEYEASIDVSAEHSDNILRTNSNEQSDTEQRAILDFSLNENTQTIQANIDYSAEYTRYANDTIDNETIIEGITELNITLLPKTLSWDLFSSTQSLRRDRRDTDIISNRERRDIISTGPSLALRLSNVDQLALSARYTDTQFEDSESSDNERTSGQIAWNHKLPRNRQLALVHSFTKTEFDITGAADIELQTSYLAYATQFLNSQLTIKAGYNESERDGFEDVDGTFLELVYDYQSGNNQFSAFATHQITDSTIGLGDNSDANNENISSDDSNFAQIDIVERTHGNLRFTNQGLCTGCALSIALLYDDQDFSSLDDDETSLTVSTEFSYQIRQNLNVDLGISRESVEFNDISDREDDVDAIELRFNYLPSPDLIIYLTLRDEERSSDLASAEYDEYKSGLGIRYSF